MSETFDSTTTFNLIKEVMNTAWSAGAAYLTDYGTAVSNTSSYITTQLADNDTYYFDEFQAIANDFESDLTPITLTTATDLTPLSTSYTVAVDYTDLGTAPTVVTGYASGYAVTGPTVVEPTVVIPDSADVTDIFDQFQTEYLELVALLAAKFGDFMTTYFPTEGLAYDAAEDWLVATISDPTGAAAAIWEDDRSRINDEATRKVAEATAFWAAKRFPLPPGAAANQVLRIQQAAQSELAKSSRTAAIQSIELVKFAVDKALQLRQVALSAAKDYITALASGPDMASRMVNIGYDAQSKLISAAAQFYSARINAKQLILDADKTTASLAVEASKTNASLTLEASKADASLSVDVAKAKAGFQIDANKAIASMNLDADKTNIGLQADIIKMNKTMELDIEKTERTLELDRRKVLLQAEQLKLEAAKGDQQARIQLIGENVKTLMAEAQILGQTAAALFNNLHVSAGASTSAGRSIGYSYSGDVSSDVPAAT